MENKRTGTQSCLDKRLELGADGEGRLGVEPLWTIAVGALEFDSTLSQLLPTWTGGFVLSDGPRASEVQHLLITVTQGTWRQRCVWHVAPTGVGGGARGLGDVTRKLDAFVHLYHTMSEFYSAVIFMRFFWI